MRRAAVRAACLAWPMLALGSCGSSNREATIESPPPVTASALPVTTTLRTDELNQCRDPGVRLSPDPTANFVWTSFRIERSGAIDVVELRRAIRRETPIFDCQLLVVPTAVPNGARVTFIGRHNCCSFFSRFDATTELSGVDYRLAFYAPAARGCPAGYGGVTSGCIERPEGVIAFTVSGDPSPVDFPTLIAGLAVVKI